MNYYQTTHEVGPPTAPSLYLPDMHQPHSMMPYDPDLLSSIAYNRNSGNTTTSSTGTQAGSHTYRYHANDSTNLLANGRYGNGREGIHCYQPNPYHNYLSEAPEHMKDYGNYKNALNAYLSVQQQQQQLSSFQQHSTSIDELSFGNSNSYSNINLPRYNGNNNNKSNNTMQFNSNNVNLPFQGKHKELSTSPPLSSSSSSSLSSNKNAKSFNKSTNNNANDLENGSSLNNNLMNYSSDELNDTTSSSFKTQNQQLKSKKHEIEKFISYKRNNLIKANKKSGEEDDEEEDEVEKMEKADKNGRNEEDDDFNDDLIDDSNHINNSPQSNNNTANATLVANDLTKPSTPNQASNVPINNIANASPNNNKSYMNSKSGSDSDDNDDTAVGAEEDDNNEDSTNVQPMFPWMKSHQGKYFFL